MSSASAATPQRSLEEKLQRLKELENIFEGLSEPENGRSDLAGLSRWGAELALLGILEPTILLEIEEYIELVEALTLVARDEIKAAPSSGVDGGGELSESGIVQTSLDKALEEAFHALNTLAQKGEPCPLDLVDSELECDARTLVAAQRSRDEIRSKTQICIHLLQELKCS